MEQLTKLQDLDLIADRLRTELESLPEKETYEAELNNLSELQSELTKVLKDDEEQTKIVKKLEGQIGLLEEKMKKEESKLYDGRTTNSKELMSIQQEIDSLRKERDKEETDYLLELEKLDPLDSKLKELKSTEAESSDRSEKLRIGLENKTKDVQSRLEEKELEISQVRKDIKDDILSLYDKLRKSKKGIAVAIVKEGICQGCNLAISTEEADKMTYEDEVWRCEHCKRILVEK
jgi:predicted  nucleic acid-binding Zn-ribbon protein